MTTEPVHSRAAGAGLFLPADGLSLLGEHQGTGYSGRRFLVSRGDGQIIHLSLLLYLIMAAVAEGGVDGGWSADQVGARVGAASGQGLTADNVRYLITGKLAPLGLVAAVGANHPDGGPGAAQPSRLSLRPGLKLRAAGLRHRAAALRHRAAGAAGAAARALAGAAGRRAGPLPLRLPYGRRRLALLIGGAAVLLSAAAAAPIMAGTGTRKTGGATPAYTPAAAAAASRSQAAAWVAQQVSPEAAVACDPGMCGQLRLDGFPAARLKPLPRSARGLLGSGVVVATPAVRKQLGPRLAAAYAPQVIASFGSGAARVDVRTIAPAGATAFMTQLAAEQGALASAGRQLLGNKNIQASPSARAALWAGQVDARLLAILSLLSAQMPVRLAEFAAAPGAGPGVLLRAAEIGVTSTAARSAVVALLDAQRSPYRPTAAAVADGSGGGFMVALRFDAPAALNISQP